MIFPGFEKRFHLDAVHGAAIEFGNDHVLRDVHQTAGEVTGIGGLESRVRQTFPGAVSGNEVLQHGKAFAEIGRDRSLDDFSRRLGHQTAHSGQLAHLVFAAASARIGHHVDGIKGLNLLGFAIRPDDFRGGDLLHHLGGDIFRRLGPDVHRLVVLLTFRDQTFIVLAIDLGHLLEGVRRGFPAFRWGMIISLMEMESPERVANSYPRSLSRSAKITVALTPAWR